VREYETEYVLQYMDIYIHLASIIDNMKWRWLGCLEFASAMGVLLQTELLNAH
jgi:hypothetical protein